MRPLYNHASNISTHLILTFLLLLTTAVAQQVHIVSVGRNETDLALRFFPETTIAAIGDSVQFQFYPLNHSVVQSLPERPCAPMPPPSGFFSGFMPLSPSDDILPTFTIRVRDAQPIYFFCAQGQHCESGFVGAINPRAELGVEQYRRLAMSRRGRQNGRNGLGGGVGAGMGGNMGNVGGNGSNNGGNGNSGTNTGPGVQVPTRPAQNANQEERVVNVGAIVGGILGGVAILVLAVVGFGAWLIRKKGGFGLGMNAKERERALRIRNAEKGGPDMVDLRIVSDRRTQGNL